MSEPGVRRALVLAGGLTFERDVSLRSGRRVADALRSAGVEVDLRDADAALLDSLSAHPPEAAFIALHGGPGEDGAIRGVLDLARVPYAGTSAPAARVAFDKPSAKALLRTAGLATPDWVTLPQATFRELGAHAVLDRLLTRLPLPLVVKPARGGSALGVTRVDRPEALSAAMVHCFSYGDTALVEQHIAGVELAVSVVEDDPAQASAPRALPAVEIVPKEGVFDYDARYTAGSTDYFVPARLDDDELATAQQAAVRAHTVLGLRDLSRTDLIVGPDGTPWFLEVNVAPGMTETSLLPMAAAAAGLDLGALCRSVLNRAVARASRAPGS
ncbi:MAG TPA: D-alanine--D-alanine ligase [Mycobacteriales bacterium]|nr:D-alanine--D-alanine ligase [Mycobacteriales bacterium]